MITKSLTITRNFRIHNEDVYLKETRERVVDLQDGEDATEVEQIVVQDMIASFKKSYPKVYTHLNFDEVIDYSNNLADADKWTKMPSEANHSVENNLYNAKRYQDELKRKQEVLEKKQAIEEPYDIIKEMDSCKSLTVLKIYERQCETDEQKAAYKKKAKELQKQSV